MTRIAFFAVLVLCAASAAYAISPTAARMMHQQAIKKDAQPGVAAQNKLTFRDLFLSLDRPDSLRAVKATHLDSAKEKVSAVSALKHAHLEGVARRQARAGSMNRFANRRVEESVLTMIKALNEKKEELEI